MKTTLLPPVTGNVKVADPKLVIKLGAETIATKSKDLQIAVWLVESLLKANGFAGMKEGFDLCKGILDNFWDNCYPEIEDGDLEMRATPLDWLGSQLDVPLRLTPILKNGYTFAQFGASRTVPTEADIATGSEEKINSRKAAIEEGKITPEEWIEADKLTPNDFLVNMAAQLDGCILSAEALNVLCDEKFGNTGPNFAPAKKMLTEVRHTIKIFLKARGIVDGPAEAAEEAGGTAETAGDGAVFAGGPRGLSITGVMPAGIEEVPVRLEAIAKYLRDQNPASPGAYMMLRGLRWGELRGLGSNPDARDLPAPSTDSRMAVKRAFLNEDWEGCITASENVMASPGGRGWLDVHRYTVKSCEALGYDLVANAIKNELRSLLADLPDLLHWQLLDDSPTANSKTIEWLREIQGEQPVAPRSVPDLPPEPLPRSGRDAFDTAREFVKAGNAGAALRGLREQLAKEATGRGRFDRKMQIASVLLEAGNDLLAQTYVDECVAMIEAHKLEDWEVSSWLAEWMATCLTCLNKREADLEMRQKLYQSIARLDPARALTCSV